VQPALCISGIVAGWLDAHDDDRGLIELWSGQSYVHDLLRRYQEVDLAVVAGLIDQTVRRSCEQHMRTDNQALAGWGRTGVADGSTS
jgi:hypothetical protein